MIVEKFATLPPWIDYQGVNFELQLFVNGRSDDVRLCFSLSHVDQDSQHRAVYDESGSWINPFNGNAMQGFLFLIENIATDEDLIQAIDECHNFLKDNCLE
jgi:hypothetical protein